MGRRVGSHGLQPPPSCVVGARVCLCDVSRDLLTNNAASFAHLSPRRPAWLDALGTALPAKLSTTSAMGLSHLATALPLLAALAPNPQLLMDVAAQAQAQLDALSAPVEQPAYA